MACCCLCSFCSEVHSEEEITRSPLLQDKGQNAVEDVSSDIKKTATADDDTTNTIIRVKNVHKTYLLGLDGVPALRGVSLNVKRGEFIVILGKSGGGKTSLLNILGTIDKPSKGELYIANKRITSETTDDEFASLRLHNIGFVFQQFNLISSMSAVENVSLPMVLDGTRSKSEIEARARMLLDKVGIGSRSSHVPSQLSGGEQQRVTIARAISNSPDILLLDEPTGDLDTKNSHLIMQLLLDLNRREGVTMIMVTHDNDLRLYAHRIVHMMDGKILRIEENPATIRAAKDKELLRLIEEDTKDKKDMLEQRDGVTELRKAQGFYKTLRPVSSTAPSH